tara:strand:- start:267 stop:662 length:396 start_codon:yes stop_codon:yes gene_type:complete
MSVFEKSKLKKWYELSFWPVVVIGNAALQFCLYFLLFFLFMILTEAKMNYKESIIVGAIFFLFSFLMLFSILSSFYIVWKKIKNNERGNVLEKKIVISNYSMSLTIILIVSLYLILSRCFGNYLIIWGSKL